MMMMYVVISTTFSNYSIAKWTREITCSSLSSRNKPPVDLSFSPKHAVQQKNHPALLTSMSRSFTVLDCEVARS